MSDEQEQSGAEDLQHAKAGLIRAITRAVGIAIVAAVPAGVAWLDTRAVAENAAGAAAKETATNELAYDELTRRIEALERSCLMRRSPREGPPVLTKTATTIEYQRPAPSKDMIDAAQERVLEGAF